MNTNEQKLNGAIEVLEDKLQAQLEASRHTMQMIDVLRVEAGLAPKYPESQSKTGSTSIRGDQFYGRPTATCMREILEMRRAAGLGTGTVNDIYDAMKQGGYQFGSSNDKNAKDGLRLSLLKNPIFHKLPNGAFGLSAWYTEVKKDKGPKRVKRRAKRNSGSSVQELGLTEAEADQTGDNTESLPKQDAPKRRGRPPNPVTLVNVG